jgi:hypothetical protein
VKRVCVTAIRNRVDRSEGVSDVSASELEHNEFVLYDVAQVRMRYLLHVRFHFAPFDDNTPDAGGGASDDENAVGSDVDIDD